MLFIEETWKMVLKLWHMWFIEDFGMDRSDRFVEERVKLMTNIWSSHAKIVNKQKSYFTSKSKKKFLRMIK